jgi:PAS domain S-box-containing protein
MKPSACRNESHTECRAELLEFALDRVREAAYLIEDGSMQILYVNQEACRALGYSREELLSMTIFDISPYFDLDKCDQVRQSLDTIGFLTFETAHRAKDGREFPVEVQVTRFIYEGKLTRIGLARDITERKAAEEKLERITHLYAVLNQCNQAIVRCSNQDELFTQICHDAVHYGKMKMAWIGLIAPDTGSIQPVASYGEGVEYLQGIETSSDAANPLGLGCNTAVRENKPVWCQDFTNAFDAAQWGASASLPLHQDGAVIGAITLYTGEGNVLDEAARNLLIEMAIDISNALNRFSFEARRTQMEQALQESEQQFRTLAENSPNIIMRYDRHCRRIYVNPAYERKTGVSFGQAKGKTPLQQWGVGTMSAEEYMATVGQVIDSGIATTIMMEWAHPDTGEPTSHDIHIVPEYDPDGKIRGAIAIGHSISALKRTERKLQESHAQMRELTHHMESVREEERRRIARELHDELGQQLMALRLSINLLNFRSGPQWPEAIHDLLDRVDSIIQVTRDVTSSLRPPVLEMGIVPALEWLTHEFSRHAGIDCELHAIQGDISMQEDQVIALFRVAQEALTNATRHAQASHMNVTFEYGAGAYLLQVEDNGIGFDTALPRKHKSFGLIGMREHIFAVGGELIVSSTPGSGTVVRALIPGSPASDDENAERMQKC